MVPDGPVSEPEGVQFKAYCERIGQKSVAITVFPGLVTEKKTASFCFLGMGTAQRRPEPQGREEGG